MKQKPRPIKTAPVGRVRFAAYVNEEDWFKAWWSGGDEPWVVLSVGASSFYSDDAFFGHFTGWLPVGEEDERYIQIGEASIRIEDGYDQVMEGMEQEGDKQLHPCSLKWEKISSPYIYQVSSRLAVIRPIKSTRKEGAWFWIYRKVIDKWVAAEYLPNRNDSLEKEFPFMAGVTGYKPDAIGPECTGKPEGEKE